MEKEYYSKKDIEVRLGICKTSVWKMFNRPDFPKIQIGQKQIVKKTDFEEYLKSHNNKVTLD